MSQSYKMYFLALEDRYQESGNLYVHLEMIGE